MLSCDSRMLVPRPASNCSFTAPQLLSSLPKLTSVPAPAWPLKTAGPLCVPVSVTVMHGAAWAAVTGAMNKRLQMPRTGTTNRFIIGSRNRPL